MLQCKQRKRAAVAVGAKCGRLLGRLLSGGKESVNSAAFVSCSANGTVAVLRFCKSRGKGCVLQCI